MWSSDRRSAPAAEENARRRSITRRSWLLLAICAAACSPKRIQAPTPTPETTSEAHHAPAASKRSSADADAQDTAEVAKACAPWGFSAPPEPEGPVVEANPKIEDPDGRGLASFHEALARHGRANNALRLQVAFYGDSNLTLDQLSGALRRELQSHFGDGGHGFVGVGSPWRGYRHQDVRRTMVGHWETYILSRGKRPRFGDYGAAGMAAASAEPGAKFKLQTAEESSPVGTRASRLTVFYLRHPKGGRFRVRIDDAVVGTVDTHGPSTTAADVSYQVADASHRFVVEVNDKKFVHLFGAALDRQQGLSVDTFAVTGATYGTIAKLNEELAQPLLAHRRHQLVVFMLGTNFWNSKENVAGLAALMARHRAVEPKVSVLVLGPPDHVRTKTSTTSDPRVVAVGEELRGAALRAGAAFWDVRQAMGGDASMRDFYYKGLAGKDLYHLTKKGAVLLGKRLAHALLASHAHYARENPQVGCAPEDPAR